MAINSDSDTVPIWLDTVLSTATGLEVWEDSIPRGARLPAIVIKMQGPGREVTYVPSRPAVFESVWQVVVVDQTTLYEPLSPYAKRVHEAIQGKFAGNVNGQDVISCMRQGVLRLPDDTDIPHRKLGGIYRVQIVDHAS